jgi:NIPSNAP
MIYELRNYTAQPGRLRDLLARFENHTNRIWARYGIRQAGFWTTVVGPTEGLSYLLAWESFAEREEKWNALRADPELLEAFAESEKNGPLVSNVENLLLQPTSFSAVT